MKLNSFFYQNVHSVIVKKINIYQKARKSRAVKYDRLHSYTWKDIVMMMKKYYSNPNAFIQIFTVIIDLLKKS